MGRITFRLPDHLHQKVKALAEAERRSMNEMLVMIVEEGTASAEVVPAPVIDGQTQIDVPDVRSGAGARPFKGPDPK
jgi:predicted transcriptional regulator